MCVKMLCFKDFIVNVIVYEPPPCLCEYIYVKNNFISEERVVSIKRLKRFGRSPFCPELEPALLVPTLQCSGKSFYDTVLRLRLSVIDCRSMGPFITIIVSVFSQPL